MKDAIKTGILVIILLVIGFIVIGINDNIQKGVELLSRTKLPLTDPTIKILYPRIENNNLLRKADLDTSKLSSEDIIFYFFDKITKNDYKTRKYDAVKIYCTINSKIEFTTDKDSCNVMIINNSTITNFQKTVFNTDYAINFKDINYKGYYCKNNGSKYYCLKNPYVDTVVGYSVFEDAYEDKDGVVIHEYYLNIDLNDKERCLNYFTQDYCYNFQKKEKVVLPDEKIKQDGVLYEHRFVKNNDNYYLKRSFVVSD